MHSTTGLSRFVMPFTNHELHIFPSTLEQVDRQRKAFCCCCCCFRVVSNKLIWLGEKLTIKSIIMITIKY